MTPAPLPDEAARLLALDEMNLLDTPADPVLDGLVRCAAALTGCPFAVVSLLDRDRLWFMAKVGLDLTQTRRHGALCAHAMLDDSVFEVPDAACDPRFADNALVTGEPRLRFYAGAPIVVAGHRIGTLCVVGREPQRLDGAQRTSLVDLAHAVEHWITSRVAHRRLLAAQRELEQAHHERFASEQASRVKTELLSQVSHELRTPLNAVLGFTQLMQADALLPERTRTQLQHVRAASQHVLDLVDDILHLARIEHGLRVLEPRPVDVSGVLGSSLALVEPLAKQRAVQLILVRGAESAVALADARALAQVLLNLLSNGIKYNRERGRLWIEVRNVAAEVAICVTDEGEGLSQAQRERLFQPFDRLGAEQGQVPGSGLGLVISRQLVEAMRGRLECRARPEGGCCFEVRLPAIPPAPEAHAGPARASAGA